MNNKQQGFSLIELVITIVVLGIALTALSSSLFTSIGKNADPLWQTKATQLSQAYLDEILAMKYQEDSLIEGNRVGTCVIGGTETGESDRSDFDDVDDYNGLTETARFLDGTSGLASTYSGYRVSIAVTCVDAQGNTSNNSKLIELTITSPTSESLIFSAYRADL